MLHPPPHLLLVTRSGVALPALEVRGREQVGLPNVGQDGLVRQGAGLPAHPEGEALVHVDGDEVAVIRVEDDGGEDRLAFQMLVRVRARKLGGGGLDFDEDGDLDAVGEDPMFVWDEKLQYPG